MTLPSVAIVIPTRNRIEPLMRCLGQIVPYVSAHPECQIVVSDDGDASQTEIALAREFGGVRVIQGPRRGPAANRNWGATHSSGELLIFLDDDCVPESNLVAVYQNALINHPASGVFEGRISVEGKISSFADTAPANETGGYLWSCNFAIRRDLFETLGGFDDRFPFAAMEDVELHLRIKRSAIVPFLPDARVWHGIEKRVGWKTVQHHTLSVILFLHIHGLETTNKSVISFVRQAAQILFVRGRIHLRMKNYRHPEQLIFQVWANLQLSLIVMFWRFHRMLARVFYPPCCPGCVSVHAALARRN